MLPCLTLISYSTIYLRGIFVIKTKLQHTLNVCSLPCILRAMNRGAGEDSWESLGPQGDQTSQSWRKSVLNIHWKDWWWSWNSNTLATSCKELTQWTWVWENSRSWRWTGKPGVLQSMGSQRVRHDWGTKQQLRTSADCLACFWPGCLSTSH